MFQEPAPWKLTGQNRQSPPGQRPKEPQARPGKPLKQPLRIYTEPRNPSRLEQILNGLEFVGVHREGGTPGSIPNPEVKPFIADDTAYSCVGT